MKMKEYFINCYCGSPASLRENKLLYGGKSYGNGKAYICNRFPDCRGSVGTHPNGKPLGTIPNAETKILRQKLHKIVDPLWQNQAYLKRGNARNHVYSYLSKIMGMTGQECHIGNFDSDTCLRAMQTIMENPYVPPTGLSS